MDQPRIPAAVTRRAALAALDPILRETLALTVGSAMSYEEVASIVGGPVGTVKSRVFRARRKLRALLGESAGDVIRQETEREIQTRTVYADCRHSPEQLQRLNAALAEPGSASAPGGGQLPAADAAGR